MTSLPPTPETLAHEFSDALKAVLSHQEIREVVRRNSLESHARICHSHDFCDTNVVLLDVFLKYGMDIADVGGRDQWGQLWDESWRIAKKSDFFTS